METVRRMRVDTQTHSRKITRYKPLQSAYIHSRLTKRGAVFRLCQENNEHFMRADDFRG